MKKKLFVAAVAAMLVLACVLSFAACTPSLEKLKSTYSDNDYACVDIDVSGVLDKLPTPPTPRKFTRLWAEARART